MAATENVGCSIIHSAIKHRVTSSVEYVKDRQPLSETAQCKPESHRPSLSANTPKPRSRQACTFVPTRRQVELLGTSGDCEVSPTTGADKQTNGGRETRPGSSGRIDAPTSTVSLFTRVLHGLASGSLLRAELRKTFRIHAENNSKTWACRFPRRRRDASAMSGSTACL